MSLKNTLQRFLAYMSCRKIANYSKPFDISFGFGAKIMKAEGSKVELGSGIIAHSFVILGTHRSHSELKIGKNCDFGEGSRIVGYNSVTIGDNVLTGPRVFISDANHEYHDITRPIMHQGLYVPDGGKLSIGDGTWIGTNAVVIGNVKIGRNCVIGANAVVTTDISDYCVAAGIPAKIIKRYDISLQKWIKVQ